MTAKMKLRFEVWEKVARLLKETVREQEKIAAEEQETPVPDGKSRVRLNLGQRASLVALAARLPNNGVLVADEVGMGKTRIAVEVARCVTECGGRVAILIPPGLGYQWRSELQDGHLDCEPILRSLWGYFKAWSHEDPKEHKPWFAEDVVLMSHQFCNWRLSEKVQNWRWALLPEVYARLLKQLQPEVARHRITDDLWVRNAADSIVAAVPRDPQHPARRILKQLIRDDRWPQARHSDQYSKNSDLRQWLEKIVGVGLGVFDLVIIDEAHKNRGEDGMLNRLLKITVRATGSSRTLGLTATPVELEADDLEQIFKRLEVDDGNGGANISKVINEYSSAVKNLQRGWQSNPDARATFKKLANRFKETLTPFLLRRDKREEPMVKKFAKLTGLSPDRYRRESELRIDPINLSKHWRQVICAAESLSVVKDRSQSFLSKRLRLTLGSGYGLANILDTFHYEEECDKEQREFDKDMNSPTSAEKESSVDENDNDPDAKVSARAEWWMDVVKRNAPHGERSLFEYPTIQRVVEEIQKIQAEHSAGRKVLVFGKFTKPMRALVNLLNAHEMLRCLDKGIFWPQTKVHEGSGSNKDDCEWAAIQAAHKVMHNKGKKRQISLRVLNTRLKRQYDKEQSRRKKFSRTLIAKIERGMARPTAELSTTGAPEGTQTPQFSEAVRAVFQAFRRHDAKSDEADSDRPLTLVSRAVADSLGNDYNDRSDVKYAEAFSDLVTAASDNDEMDNLAGKVSEEKYEDDSHDYYDDENADNGNGASDKLQDAVWSNVFQRLKEEYSHLRGGFARLMIGPTRNESRRIIQQAFNRPNSYPRVLVAQSLVGREGLNLHKSCCVVILLHMEWNAGVVEQQIGRVDRVGSLWCQEMEQKVKEPNCKPEDLPRIDVRQVVFSGTYDEQQWQILKSRMDDNRAQLHGVIIPPSTEICDDETKKLAAEIQKVAPNFSPTPKCKKTIEGIKRLG